ncbi:TPA: EpsG family protein [Klebsiella pneumoniae]
MRIINENIVVLSFYFLFFFFIIIGAYSPVTGFYIPLIFLALTAVTARKFRSIIVFIAIFNGAFIVASRNYIYGSPIDDFYNIYYPVYEYVRSGGTIFYTDFSGGIEFILPLYFKVLSLIYSSSAQVYVLASVSFLCYFLFYLWLEFYGMEKIDSTKQSLCIASALGLMNILVTTQSMRQALSSCFVLFAISMYRHSQRKRSLVFFILSVCAHTTGLIFAPLFSILLYGNKRIKLILLSIILLISVFFGAFISVALSLNIFGAATYKLLYYTSTEITQVSELGIDNLKFLFICVILSFFFFARDKIEYKSLLLYGIIIFIALLPIPVLPARFMFLVYYYLIGYILFLSAYKISNVYRIVLIIFLIYKTVKLIMGDGSFTGDHVFWNLWYSYPSTGDELFYYIR